MGFSRKVSESGEIQEASHVVVGNPTLPSCPNPARVANFPKTPRVPRMAGSFFSPAAIILAFLAFLTGNVLAGERITGHVVGITDGDTITVFTSIDGAIKVRLASIDAPEKYQAFGTRAREVIAALCFDKPAEIEATGHDRNGRTVGAVRCAGIDVGEELVRRGFAWVFPRYAPKESPLYSIEREAREERRGLWSDPAPTPPWEWRRKEREIKKVRPSAWRTEQVEIIGVCYGFTPPKNRKAQKTPAI